MKFEDQLIRRLDTVYRRTFNLPRKDSAEDVFHSITQVQEEGVAIVDYMRLSYIFDSPKNFKKFVRALGYNFIPQGIEYVGEDFLEDYLIIQLVEEFDPDNEEEGVELYEQAIDRKIIYVSDLQEQVIRNSAQTEREFLDELMEDRYGIDPEYELPEEDPGTDILDSFGETIEDKEHLELREILEELEYWEGFNEKIEEAQDDFGIELDTESLQAIKRLLLHEDRDFQNQGFEILDSLGGVSNFGDILAPIHQRTQNEIKELKEKEQTTAQKTFDDMLYRYREQAEKDWDNDWHWQLPDELEGYWGMLDHETNLQEITESDFYQGQWAKRASFSYNTVLDTYQRPIQLYSYSPNQLQLFGA